ncbi:MAG: mannitol-1-phosphate 5-dehydrogenase, partial [Enterococcus sp.]
MKAVHFGAGNIGRGFIGQVLRNSGFSLVFVDTNQEVIDQINLDQGYFIEVLDEMQTQFWIDQVSAINSNDTEKVIDELIDCDLITTSVGAGNLKYIAPVLKSAMLKRYSDGNK